MPDWNPGKFYQWLRDLIDGGPWKVLFASDAPRPNAWVPLDEWVKAINEPDTDIPFWCDELDRVGFGVEINWDVVR